MALAAIDTGPDAGGGSPLVILHGLLGNARNWSGMARRLSRHRRVVVFDLPNHGASPWTEGMDYPLMARLVAAEIEALGAPVALMGHSMGGKAAMALALSRPELVERLIVIDIAPTRYGHSYSQVLRAMRSVPLATARHRAEIDAALATDLPDRAFRAFVMQSLESGPPGYRWRANLPVLLAGMEDILGFPDVPAGRTYSGPTLFIAGGRSDYLRPEHWPAILRLFPAAREVVIASAGHWVHADDPDALERAVADFVAGQGQGRSA